MDMHESLPHFVRKSYACAKPSAPMREAAVIFKTKASLPKYSDALSVVIVGTLSQSLALAHGNRFHLRLLWLVVQRAD